MDHLDLGKNIGSDAAKQFINRSAFSKIDSAQEMPPIPFDIEEEPEDEDQEEMNDDAEYGELINALQALFLANYSFQFKAQSLHWNLVDPNYVQYHAFYNEVYSTAAGVVDTYAEWLRRLDAPAPFSASGSLPSLVTDLREGLGILLSDVESFIVMLRDTLNTATELNEQGLVNFLSDQQDVHQKLRWFIKSILGS
jgi:starvation-inducible DNA-binding protein